MTVRGYDRVDDRIQCATGGVIQLGQGAFTIAFLINLSGQDGAPIYVGSTSGAAAKVTVTPFAFNWHLNVNGTYINTLLDSSNGQGWTLVAFTKAAGTATPRCHKYVFDTATWTHVNAALTLGTTTGNAQTVWFGFNDGSYIGMNHAVSGAWHGTVLSDVQIETLILGLQEWVDLAPSGLWAFNQAATTDPVTDITGNGANQTAITGTTVVAGGDPPGFDFTLGAAPVQGAAVLSAESTLTASATARARAAAALTADGTLTAAGRARAQATAALSAQASMTTAARVRAIASAVLSGAGTLVIATGVIRGAASLTAAATMAVAARVRALGSATLTGDSSMTAAGTARAQGAAQLNASGTLGAVGRVRALGRALLSALGTLSAAGNLPGEIPKISEPLTLTSATDPHTLAAVSDRLTLTALED